MLQDFDAIVARENTDCQQYDDRMNQFGRSDVQPMSVADMDFRAPDCVREALLRLIDHGIYGYHLKTPKYYEAIIDWLWWKHHYAVEPQSVTLSGRSETSQSSKPLRSTLRNRSSVGLRILRSQSW